MPRRILALLVLLLSTLPCSAQGVQTEPNQPAPSVPRQQGPTDPQELEAFLDPFFAEQMEKFHIPGAVFLLVKDGEIFFTLPWYDTTAFQRRLGNTLLLVFFSACLVWPVSSLIRRLRKQPSSAPRAARLARLLAGFISALNLVFLVGLNLAVVRMGQEFVYGMPPLVIALLCIPLLTTLLTVLLPIWTVFAWKDKYWSLVGRLHYSLITLAALAYIPFLSYWNLLGFRF